MEIVTLEVAGFKPALKAMRNPMNSWAKSDTACEYLSDGQHVTVGENDKSLSVRLQTAGSEHCKHLRMIEVWADITSSLTWWKQFDTYRFGIEKVSTSTMHKLMSRPLTLKDFASVKTDVGETWSSELNTVIGFINDKIEKYKNCTELAQKKIIWQETIDLLPESYLQMRTVMMSYAALRNIVRQREGHKLPDWHKFIEWAHTLPESWMIFDGEKTK